MTRVRHAWLVAVALSSTAAVGCAPDPAPVDDGVVETAHLRITNTTGNPICAGTSLLLEGELERIAAALDMPLWGEDDKLDVRFGLDAVTEVCSGVFGEQADQARGCATTPDDEVVVAAVEVANTGPHELVHAIRMRNGIWSTILFEEGMAELLSGSDGFPRRVRYPHGESFAGPLEMLQIPREDFHGGYYQNAASFVSWLWETEGRSPLMVYVDDPAFEGAESALPLFEQHYGLPLADAEDAWRNDDRPDPIWGAPCTPERTHSLADGPVDLSGELDCTEPEVYGASSWMSLWPMCLDVPETTRVRIAFEADHGRLEILWREPCDPGPSSAEASQDKYLDAGEIRDTDIIGCRFRMLLHSPEPGFPTTSYSIRIEEIGG